MAKCWREPSWVVLMAGLGSAFHMLMCTANCQEEHAKHKGSQTDLLLDPFPQSSRKPRVPRMHLGKRRACGWAGQCRAEGPASQSSSRQCLPEPELGPSSWVVLPSSASPGLSLTPPLLRHLLWWQQGAVATVGRHGASPSHPDASRSGVLGTSALSSLLAPCTSLGPGAAVRFCSFRGPGRCLQKRWLASWVFLCPQLSPNYTFLLTGLQIRMKL